ncbi:hypothetical protein ACFTSF_04560 [Kribbella sp. NPDC056951]|uniref:hypothetical protein n=1 Tax=Kribbella sp. NPDC056951 TaxID=3345978 RepID=UPI00362F55CD
MKLTAKDFGGVRLEHLSGVTAAEFAEVWQAIEDRADELSAAGRDSDFVTGMLQTCRWIAEYRWWAGEVVPSPITGQSMPATPELIEAEVVAVEQAVRAPSRVGRPDYVGGVWATFMWTWRGSGVPPLRSPRTQAS